MSETTRTTAAPRISAGKGGADWAEAALARLRDQDRKTRRNTILLTLIPIVVAAGLIAVTTWQVKSAVALKTSAETAREHAVRERDDAVQQLSETRGQIEAAQVTVRAVRRELDESQSRLTEARTAADAERARAQEVTERLKDVEKRLKEVGSLAPFAHRIGPEDMKGMYGSNPSRVVDAVNEMLNLKERGTPFNISGKELKDGLNSPMFMAHILSMTDRFRKPGAMPLTEYSSDLFARLRGEAIPQGQLQPGDLVIYETGYTMMYARDYQNRPFVIGMTPAGILPLEPDFAKQTAWYRGIGRQ